MFHTLFAYRTLFFPFFLRPLRVQRSSLSPLVPRPRVTPDRDSEIIE